MKIFGSEVITYDDKKEKHQSWEATLDKRVFESGGYANFDATGYGSTEVDAISELVGIMSLLLAIE